MGGRGQEVIGHVHQKAGIAGGVFAEGLEERGGQEPGVASGFESMVEAVLKLFWGQGLQAQAGANAAGDG